MSINKIAEAEALGRAAFKRGAACVPAHDPGVLPLLSGLKVGEGLPILTAWHRGWTYENLAAPIDIDVLPEGNTGQQARPSAHDPHTPARPQ